MEHTIWYYMQDGNQVGPTSIDQIRSLIYNGDIAPETQVWSEGMDQWQPAGQLSELFPDLTEAVACPESASPQRPTSVTVFGIMNIFFGVMNLVCTPVSIAGMYFTQVNQSQRFLPPAMNVMSIVGYVIGFFVGILLLVTGVGLLKLRAWARKISYGYGWFAVVWCVIGTLISAGAMIPVIRENAQANPEIMGGLIGGLVGGVCGGVFGLIYPIFLIIFMRRPNVIQACDQ